MSESDDLFHIDENEPILSEDQYLHKFSGTMDVEFFIDEVFHRRSNQTVTICNQAGQEFQTQLIACNADVDFVVVFSEVPLVPVSPTISLPRQLERYILLGYPNANSSYEALEGIISSVRLDDKGRMRGSSGSQREYSGGPMFNYKGELLGINVANESSQKFIGLSGRSTLDELFSEVNAAFPSLSVIVPVWNLAMGIHLNFQQ